MSPEERIAWLKERQTGIGSSDAPNLCGVGWDDAAAVYRSKVEPITQADGYPKGILLRGTMLEPFVAQLYCEKMGTKLKKVPMVRHPERHWQYANIDYTTDPDFGEIEISDASREAAGHDVECKTVTGFGFEWGEEGTDDFPENYRIQCQHQMGVRGKEYADLAALDVISWELRIYRILFIPDFFEWLTELEAKAWDMIERRQPIGKDWESQWSEEASQRLDSGTRLRLPINTIQLLERREIFKDIRDEADDHYKRLTGEVKARLGEFYKAEVGDWKITRVKYKGGVRVSEVAPYEQLRVTAPKSWKLDLFERQRQFQTRKEISS